MQDNNKNNRTCRPRQPISSPGNGLASHERSASIGECCCPWKNIISTCSEGLNGDRLALVAQSAEQGIVSRFGHSLSSEGKHMRG